jgi:hypothetical protein
LRDHAKAFAKDSPTAREPMSPGLAVAATPSIDAAWSPASERARLTTPMIHSMWARLAISGTTP